MGTGTKEFCEHVIFVVPNRQEATGIAIWTESPPPVMTFVEEGGEIYIRLAKYGINVFLLSCFLLILFQRKIDLLGATNFSTKGLLWKQSMCLLVSWAVKYAARYCAWHKVIDWSNNFAHFAQPVLLFPKGGRNSNSELQFLRSLRFLSAIYNMSGRVVSRYTDSFTLVISYVFSLWINDEFHNNLFKTIAVVVTFIQ